MVKFNRIYVTVGTTQFDKLVNVICSDNILKILAEKGCRKLVIQAGHGANQLSVHKNKLHGILIEVYDYKNSILDDIKLADLVIGHAGAGTTLEVLRQHKPLIVAINEDLMDNHQIELADQLFHENYLLKCTPTQLYETLLSIDHLISSLRNFPDPNPWLFSNFLNEKLGLKLS